LETAFKIVVGPAYAEFSDETAGDFKLYTHQVELSRDDSNVAVLDAPTGSGKTLAALKRVLDRFRPSIFVYPTNSLVRNQLESMKDLLSRLGYRPNIIDADTSESEVLGTLETTDIDVIHLTGETLELLSEGMTQAKGSIIDLILSGTHKEGRMRLLLTNPDTIYLAFIGRYRRSGRIFEQLGTFKTLILDEFHLYTGPLLARIMFMINVLRGDPDAPDYDLVFLSATHGETLELLSSTYPSLKLITASPLSEAPSRGNQIRFVTDCSLIPISRVMTEETQAVRAAQDIIRFYDTEYQGEPTYVKVLGIFSSVSFAIRVTRKVKEVLRERGDSSESSVYQLHGFIPRQARQQMRGMKNSILIGTSAIEVGIDFDVPFLVFESHDVGSFLQRFGRGGRHQPCSAVMFVPQPLADRLSEKELWTFSELVEQAHLALLELPSYAGFLCSPQAGAILLSMALASNRLPHSPFERHERFDYEAAADFYISILASNRHLSFGSRKLASSIGIPDRDKVLSDLRSYVVKIMVRHGFLRGTLNSILALYPAHLLETGVDIYAEVDLFDIFKAEGTVVQARHHWDRIPAAVRRRHSEDDPLFVIKELSRSGFPHVVLSSKAPVRWRPSVYREPECHLKHEDTHLSTLGHDVLNKRNIAFHWRSMNRHTDFRIPRLYVDDELGGLVIGDWVFIAEYSLSLKEGGDFE
jgi:CRISPR-associated helicase Cas3